MKLHQKLVVGATPRGGDESYQEIGISLIRSLNVYDFAFSYKNLAYIDDNQARKLKNVTVLANDILLNITGASVGRCCIVPDDVLPARVNQHVAIIRINESIAVPQYVYYVINSRSYKDALLNLSQTGATREALTKDDLSRFKIPLPLFKTQQQIAAILSAYDDLIETNNQRIATLEKLAQQIYKEWFVRMRFPGREQTQLHHGMPEKWERKKLSEISSFISRVITPIYDENGESIVINQKCIRNGRLNLIPSQKQSKEIPDNKKIQKNDVLINSTGEGTLGRVAIVTKNYENHTVDTHVTIARPNVEKIDPCYYGFTLLNYQNIFEFMAVGATGQTELGRKDIMNVEIELPTFQLQSRFSFLVKPMVEQIDTLIEQNEVLTKTRNLLLPRLISGKLTLKKAHASL